MNYTGALTGTGMSIGTVPVGVSPTDLYVQTSIPGEIILVDANGLIRNYWDGGLLANEGNGVVDGGNGVWNATNANWTDSTGTVNTSAGAVPLIFKATPGTVTVDDSAGQVSTYGMQFAVNGYTIAGSPLTLLNNGSNLHVIQVGWTAPRPPPE